MSQRGRARDVATGAHDRRFERLGAPVLSAFAQELGIELVQMNRLYLLYAYGTKVWLDIEGEDFDADA